MHKANFEFNNSNDILFVLREPVSVPEDFEFEKAVLVDYKNQAYDTEGCYDAARDEIHVKVNDKVKTVFPQKVKAVKIGEMIFVPLETVNEGTENIGYFQIISSGKISLLKRYVGQDSKMRKEFYTEKAGELSKLSTKKSAVLSCLDRPEIKKFVKTNKPDLKTEAGLKAVFDRYNEL